MQTPTSTDAETPIEGGDGIGRKIADKIDDQREAVAHGIDSAASSLHAKADNLPGGEKVARAAHSTAEAMGRSADYVRDQNVEAMLGDVRQAVKRHPAATLITAAAVGFLLARVFSKD